MQVPIINSRCIEYIYSFVETGFFVRLVAEALASSTAVAQFLKLFSCTLIYNSFCHKVTVPIGYGFYTSRVPVGLEWSGSHHKPFLSPAW